MNALAVSIVGGEINAVEPPYTSRFHGTADLPASIADELGWLKEGVADAREEFEGMFGRDVNVDVEVLP